MKAAVFLAFYLSACIFLHGHRVFSQAVLWLPTGVAVAGLWLLGRRYWPVVALATLTHRLWSGYAFPDYLFPVVGNTLEALTAVSIMHRLGFQQDFRRLRDGLVLLLAAVVATFVGATVGRATYLLHPDTHTFLAGWSGWWRMNGLGVLVVVPLVLSWTGGQRHRPGWREILEGLGLTALVIFAAWLLSTVDPTRQESGMVLSYLALPVALYAAMRFGARGAATAAAGLVFLLTLGTSYGFGPFVPGAVTPSSPGTHEVALQILIGIVTTTPLLLGAAVAEREDALARAAVERVRHQDLLASINQNVNDGLFRISRDRDLAYVNTAYVRMLGYDSPDELLGKPALELLADPAHAADLRQALEARGQIAGEEYLLRRKDGSVFPALISCTLLRGPDGGIEHFDGAISDLTPHKRMEEQLRETQKMEALGKLAGGVAHDFNNLLTVIAGHAELLQEALRGRAADAAHADEIRAAATRASRLTGQLLAYSRRQVLSPQVLDLQAVVAQSSAMLRRLIGEDIQLTVEPSPEDLFVRVDRGQIEQVIMNLVLNARDAIVGNGRISVAVWSCGPDHPALKALAPADLPPGPLVCLSVKDSGMGMSADVTRQAFDPFFTTKETGRGTGLGLSTVYGIVRQSGGSVWIESAPGAGTTVRVCLPRAGQPVAAPAPPPPPVAAPAPEAGTLLVVEDEPALRELLAQALSAAGWTVLAAGDGEEALRIARQAAVPIDLVVTDVIMPRMGGRKLVARLAAERAGLRVLMISGYAWGPPDWTPPVGTVVAYLQKPFAPSSLLQHVRNCLAAPAPPAA